MIVSAKVHITPEMISVDGQPVFKADDLLKDAYRSLGIDHPKFYKMDQLSKLGLLSVEYLIGKTKVNERYNDDEIALVFNNRDASAGSDLEHQKAFNIGHASPSIFVYTLPNIVLGEIAIRNKWYGEQLCTVSDQPNIGSLYQHCLTLMNKGKAKAIILLNINSIEDKFEARTLLIEKDGIHEGIPFSMEMLNQLFKEDARS